MFGSKPVTRVQIPVGASDLFAMAFRCNSVAKLAAKRKELKKCRSNSKGYTMMFDISAIAISFVALFVVMDPFASAPVFLAMTKKSSYAQRNNAAGVAAMVAAGVFLAFLLLGPLILSFLGIRIESFQIAGGLLMLLISVSFALGISFGKQEEAPVEAVIIGVPLLTGPGVMLASLLLSNTYGVENVAVAGILACTGSYVVLRGASSIHKLISKAGMEILSRVMGVLLAAFAVEFIRRGFGL